MMDGHIHNRPWLSVLAYQPAELSAFRSQPLPQPAHLQGPALEKLCVWCGIAVVRRDEMRDRAELVSTTEEDVFHATYVY